MLADPSPLDSREIMVGTRSTRTGERREGRKLLTESRCTGYLLGRYSGRGEMSELVEGARLETV